MKYQKLISIEKRGYLKNFPKYGIILLEVKY